VEGDEISSLYLALLTDKDLQEVAYISSQITLLIYHAVSLSPKGNRVAGACDNRPYS